MKLLIFRPYKHQSNKISFKKSLTSLKKRDKVVNVALKRGTTKGINETNVSINEVYDFFLSKTC